MEQDIVEDNCSQSVPVQEFVHSRNTNKHIPVQMQAEHHSINDSTTHAIQSAQ